MKSLKMQSSLGIVSLFILSRWHRQRGRAELTRVSEGDRPEDMVPAVTGLCFDRWIPISLGRVALIYDGEKCNEVQQDVADPQKI